MADSCLRIYFASTPSMAKSEKETKPTDQNLPPTSSFIGYSLPFYLHRSHFYITHHPFFIHHCIRIAHLISFQDRAKYGVETVCYGTGNGGIDGLGHPPRRWGRRGGEADGGEGSEGEEAVHEGMGV